MIQFKVNKVMIQFKVNKVMCLWCAYKEDVFNFLLICPRFAALRTSMLASVMQNTGNILCRIPVTLSLSRQVDALLHGLPFLNFKTNAAVFAAVRIFIK